MVNRVPRPELLAQRAPLSQAPEYTPKSSPSAAVLVAAVVMIKRFAHR